MNDITEIRETVKRVVKSLLVASKHGMSERGINKEYVEIEGKRLPCGPLGFSCAEDLLRSFSDILNFRRRGALIIYTCKEADTDEHVRRMVKEQKNIPSKIRHGNTSSNSHGYGNASTKGNQGIFVPAEVQNNVMSILKENKEWMKLKSFCNVYKQKFGSLPSVGNLGFETMEFLLERMRGIVNSKSMDGTLYIAAVNKEKAQESRNIKEGKSVQTCLDKKYEHDKLNIEKSNIKHVPDCVINAMKILTQENPEGIRVELLIPFYKNLTGEDLNVYSLGYSSVLELVLSLGSIFKINTTRGNDYFVTPVEVTGNKKELSSMAKTRLKSLLKFKSSGISPEQLLALYETEYPGKVAGDLDWNTLGYKGCFDLLQAQTDSVLQIQFAPNGPLIFPPVSLLDGSQPISPHVTDSNKPLAQNTKIKFTKVSGDKINKFVQIGERFKQVNVREAHEKDEWFEIEVAEVYSPHLFWAHLRENSKKLNNLMDKMMEFYARPEVLENYRISSKDCSLEMPIVSFYEEDNNFYRAVVTNFKSFDKIEVFYVDWGTNAQVHRRNLWYLDRQFFDFPAQAIQARLSGIAPSNPGHRWMNGTSKRFLQLVENRPLCAKIAGIKGSALEVELVDTTNDECDVYINERLVQEQYAICQEKPQVVSQNSTPTQSECMQKQNCGGEVLNVSDIKQNDGESYKNDIQLLQEKLQNVNIIEKTEIEIVGQAKNPVDFNNHKQEIESLSFEQQKQGLTQRYEKKQNKNNQQQEQYQQQQEHRQQLPKQEHRHHQLSLTEDCKDESLQKIMAHNQWLHSELLKSRNALMTLQQKREDNKEEIDVNFDIGSEEKQHVIKETEKLCDESKNTMDIQDSVFTEEQLVKIRDSACAKIPSTSSIEQDTFNAINGCIDQLAKKRSNVLLKLCEEPESDVWLNMVKDINEKIKKLKIFKENI